MSQEPGKSIEQVMDDLNRMLSQLGRGKKGGGNGDGSSPEGGSPQWLGLIIAGILVIAIIIGVRTSFYTVDQSEAGVVTRFGQYVRTDPPGLHFLLPFGIDKSINVPTERLLKEEFGFRTTDSRRNPSRFTKEALDQESLMLTGDLNIADVEWVVQYTIADPWKFLFHAANPQKNVRDVSISVMRRVVGDLLVSDVLGRARTEIAIRAKEITQSILDRYDMGIRIQNILLQGVNPPEPVKPAFNEVNSAKQEQEETINRAEQQYNKVIPEAKGKAEKVVANAEAFATELLNHAKGDAERFQAVLQSYQKAPAITRKRLYLEAMEDVFEDANRFTIVDSKLKGLVPIYGNMPKTLGPKE